ncbi:PREDICTED: uncharacterized protein LOC108560494 [Nicrophorus vespilloides]|uniref:Uncharacterized protein LOC108560494 n=1 Tax=Nicrophorus vespilloides TaxID=110193 RepID=A0ABM1MG56_NICVS|nr:PREDICTED: uncharacterized protein LOC108560494 [Nicrophorus vespilloides]XP_017773554.1 PREDICTED: uncharacterized protein LOC108560494 [Nicrophorus vespilloides]XP_017773555.1 PREDICTED: uncharacterized protein LOC108560494 [Nicrophorus vespilloides]XP_017773556.1 PREDICTED: uncharacterized protein LOC108560494 [Nicrophorus vespilloides]
MINRTSLGRAFASTRHLLVMLLFLLVRTQGTDEPHSRQKRLLWITSDGRLALPPGTTLVIAPSLSLPFVRYPPDGFFSNMTISLPFTIDFNKLGLTDNENPYGVLPPLLARSMGRTAGDILTNYIMKMMDHSRRRKRSLEEPAPQPPEEHKNAFHGGERALLYLAAEDFLENFGMNGKACLLRAICEVHAHPLHNFGLIGEMVRLFLSASKSPYSEVLQEYVEAENAGSGKSGPAECWPYLKDCPKSLFLPSHNKYSENADETGNEISDDKMQRVTYDPLTRNM